MAKPTKDLLEGISRAFPLELMPWDDYFARMAEADFLSGKAEEPSVKSYFVRKAPFGGSYTLLGGITAALRQLRDLPLDSPEFTEGMSYRDYGPEFLNYLAKLRRLKDVTVYAPPEGTPFFPNEPIVTLAGPLAQLRLADGLFIKELNFPSLSMTKWNRLVRAARPGGVMEFSRRRSQDTMRASLYGMLAGCIATSNSELARHIDVILRGTMGHEAVQAYKAVRAAYDAWLSVHPKFPIGLVDTVRCLEVDFPAWLEAVYEHREAIMRAGAPFWGWRNDSGDLAYLVIEQYIRFLDDPLAKIEWFRNRMRIYNTNELDEYAIASIISQIQTQASAAGLDAADILRRIIWAAGTKPGVCEDDPALGGVMKLMETEGNATIKLALDADGRIGVKTSIPGFNLSGMVTTKRGPQGILIFPAYRYRITRGGKLFDKLKSAELKVLEARHPDNEQLAHRFEDYTIASRQHVVFESGDFTADWNRPTIESVQQHVLEEVDRLPWYVTRNEKPHVFPVSVTPDLLAFRKHMIEASELQREYDPF